MGLDMYAFAVPADRVGTEMTDVKLPEGAREIAYWRKFNHLHGWMHRLYTEKGGKSEEFNCDTVRLTTDDLDRLYADLGKGLPHTPGFFFGDDRIYPEDVESTIEFIGKAKGEILAGNAVFYDSWW